MYELFRFASYYRNYNQPTNLFFMHPEPNCRIVEEFEHRFHIMIYSNWLIFHPIIYTSRLSDTNSCAESLLVTITVRCLFADVILKAGVDLYMIRNIRYDNIHWEFSLIKC